MQDKNRKGVKRLLGQAGMSLLEIIIAVGIVGTVGGYIVSKVMDRARQADIRQAQAQINDLVANVKMYKRDKKKYPEGEDGLQALVDAGIIEELPSDPWGGEFNYEAPGSRSGKKFEIWSDGPDEESETDDDVTSWNKDADE